MNEIHIKKPIKIQITLDDWKAVLAMAEIGIIKTVLSEPHAFKDSPHYKKYRHIHYLKYKVRNQLGKLK